MQSAQQPTVSQLVRADYRLADVFKKWGINYCCGGNLALEDVCRLQGLDKARLETEIQQAQQTVLLSNALQFEAWPVDFLADYIVHVHHAYIKNTAPKLEQAIESFAAGHQKKYPYLLQVHGHFKKLAATLNEHMQQEEDSLFPYVKQVSNALKRKESYGPLFVRTLHKSLPKTNGDAAQKTGVLLTALRNATARYTFFEDVCTNHQVMYRKLAEFDADLVQHQHLENNILFPKVVQLETQLLQL